jgi:hypothetical protein
MAPYGGFDHNAQAIRIVTHLERHYAEFDGLNLTWETLEGIAKHNGPVPEPVPWALAAYCDAHDLELHTHASAEAQVAALADDVAYNHHDLHDGLRAELFSTDELAELADPRRLFRGGRPALSRPQLLPPPARGAQALLRASGGGRAGPERGAAGRARPADARRTSARRGGPWCGSPMRSSPISR